MPLLKKTISLILLTTFTLILCRTSQAQHALSESHPQFTRADTLRGSITPQRAWWDVTFYDLYITIHPQDSTIEGFNRISYRVIDMVKDMQIDLQQPLVIKKIVQNGQTLDYHRVGQSGAYFVDVPDSLSQDSIYTLSVYYHGKPIVAENPPWDGGFIWAQDSLGNPWIATAVQGLGASAWWPNKDHPYDEADSIRMHFTVPQPMVAVGNGRLEDVTKHDDMATYTWFVSNPINNYGVALSAGNYVNFTDTYHGLKGELDLSYWVLQQDLSEAKEQFKQVKPMLKCFEYWFGPYPFYEDSYKLVQSPHLGMEHQSAVAYGNHFQNGYLGRDISGTGWGLKWDFIIIHESAHEWWANSVTNREVADMWIHEAFGTYAGGLYTECQFGKKAGAEFIRGLRARITNNRPIIGEYSVHYAGSSDMYPKGGNMILMIREIIDNDSTFRAMLHGIQQKFYHQTVTSRQIEDYIIAQTGKDFDDLFDQYLRETDIPVFKYYFKNERVYYKWSNVIPHFDMPVEVRLDNSGWTFIEPVSDHWQFKKTNLKSPKQFEISKNYYIKVKKAKP